MCFKNIPKSKLNTAIWKQKNKHAVSYNYLRIVQLVVCFTILSYILFETTYTQQEYICVYVCILSLVLSSSPTSEIAKNKIPNYTFKMTRYPSVRSYVNYFKRFCGSITNERSNPLLVVKEMPKKYFACCKELINTNNSWSRILLSIG